MQVWNVLHVARWNTGRKKEAKGQHLSTIAQRCQAVSSQLRHVSTVGKKFFKQQYMLHMSPQYGELRPTNCWDGFVSLGHPANLNGFRILPSLLQRRRSAEAKQTLHDVWPSPGLVHYIYIFEASCPLAELCPTSNFCVLLYWQRYCAALHQRAWPGFAAWYKEWNYGTFTEGAIYIWLGGHHVGHRPTF